MRLAVFLSAAALVFAADPYLGDWKLIPQKSSPGVKAGRALIDTSLSGQYLEFNETFFDSGDPLRFNSEMRDHGDPTDSQLGSQLIRYVATKTAAGYEVALNDPNSGANIRTIRISAKPNELNIHWTNPDLNLVYERFPQGVLLKQGSPIEQTFGIATAHEYRIDLKAGDYAVGKVDQKGGTVNMAAYRPDGSRIRTYGGPATGDKPFTIPAATTGTYRLVLRSAVSPAASYTIAIDKIAPLPESAVQPAKQKFTSPKIEALRKQLDSGNKSAIADFWRDVEKSGTPLAEPMEKEDASLLVTFLWHGDASTRNVLVIWFPYTTAHPADYMLSRLADTDVWYRTVKIRRGARFAYNLSVNDSLIFEGENFPSRSVTAQADPLNPKRWFDNPTTTNLEYQSMAELPGAKPQPYIAKRENVPAGIVERHKFKSALLDNERNLSVYLPPGYQRSGTPNHLLFVFDETAYLSLVPTPTTLDNLIAEKKIPPTVAVLIDNAGGDARGRELPPNPKFADFLNNELMPWVRQNYNVTADPKQTVVAGSSYGGIASAYAGLRHPETFGNLLCQSPSFWWTSHTPQPYEEPNYFAHEFLKSPKLPVKFYIDAGSFEIDATGSGISILEPARHVRDILIAKGYDVTYQEFIGGHDYMSWRGTLADGLIALIGTAKN
jgi:enterochelin esterase family protein